MQYFSKRSAPRRSKQPAKPKTYYFPQPVVVEKKPVPVDPVHASLETLMRLQSFSSAEFQKVLALRLKLGRVSKAVSVEVVEASTPQRERLSPCKLNIASPFSCIAYVEFLREAALSFAKPSVLRRLEPDLDFWETLEDDVSNTARMGLLFARVVSQLGKTGRVEIHHNFVPERDQRFLAPFSSLHGGNSHPSATESPIDIVIESLSQKSVFRILKEDDTLEDGRVQLWRQAQQLVLHREAEGIVGVLARCNGNDLRSLRFEVHLYSWVFEDGGAIFADCALLSGSGWAELRPLLTAIIERASTAGWGPSCIRWEDRDRLFVDCGRKGLVQWIDDISDDAAEQYMSGLASKWLRTSCYRFPVGNAALITMRSLHREQSGSGRSVTAVCDKLIELHVSGFVHGDLGRHSFAFSTHGAVLLHFERCTRDGGKARADDWSTLKRTMADFLEPVGKRSFAVWRRFLNSWKPGLPPSMPIDDELCVQWNQNTLLVG